jgi:RNA polymerase sigma factor (sigma-70 family)
VHLERELVLPWLLGVATNVLRNMRRSQRRHRAALERLPREHAHDFAGKANGRLDDERQIQTVLRAIAKLPRREQDVLALCAWAELSYEEAAVALGVPVGTVRSRLSRPGREPGNSARPTDTNRTANLPSRRRRREG